jgi:Protein of unknown function (DUF2917)
MRMVSKDRLTIARPLSRVAAILHGTASTDAAIPWEAVVILDMKRVVIELEYRGILPMKDALGTRIDCQDGRIWITEPGSTDDIVLEAGESYVISRRGVAVVQALREARVGLRAPAVHQAGAELATWVERLWSQWAARAASGHPGHCAAGGSLT